MPYTLQRKMFKLGGSVAHGGGITANLKDPNRVKMKKGGSVEQQATFGVGNNANKSIGPDGKVREAHGFFIPAAAGVLGRAGIGQLARLLGGRLGTKALAEKFAPRATSSTIKKFIKGEPIGFGAKEAIKGGFRSTPIYDKAGIAKRIAQLTVPLPISAGIGGGMALSDRLGITEEGNNDTIFEQGLRGAGALGLGLSAPNLASRLGQFAFGDPNVENENLYRMIAGKPGAKKIKGETTTKDVAEKATSEMEKLKNAALQRKELYNSVMYEPDNLKMVSDMLLQSGTSALRGDELADVIDAGFAPSNTEAARKRAVEDASGQQAVTDILNEQAGKKQMLAEVAKSGDPRAIARIKKYFDASDQGVDDILPMDAKGAMDTTQMRAGTIYADIDNSTGKLFVAVNESGSEIKQFDTVEEAIEHSQTA
tara:strand:- start:5160 stop:6434 length:1275 start_codon:yes stop_codon:yes gene_type:complete